MVSKRLLFVGTLSLFTLAALLSTAFPAASLWIFFVLLIGLMLNLGIKLDDILISPAPTAALLAYLTLGTGALWSIAAGVLLGYILLWVYQKRVMVQAGLFTANRLILGLFLAHVVYQQVDGELPLQNLTTSDIFPLALLILVYLGIDLAILGTGFLRQLSRSGPEALGIFFVPLPFAVVGAVTYHQLSSLAFGLLIFSFLIVVLGMFVLVHSRKRSRQQVLELSAISAISQAMHNNLDLNALLDVIYRQVNQLLNVNNFTVALFDANRSTLYFPLNIASHHPVPLPPHEMGTGLIEHVIEQKTSLLLPDRVAQQAQARGLTPPPTPIYSWLGVPLLAPERVLGCLVVYSTRSEQHFSSDDLRQLTTLAGQAGIAIDNAQLYGQARDRSVQLATLNNIASILNTTLNFQQVLDLVSSSAVAMASCDAVALFMWWDGTHRPYVLERMNGLSASFKQDPVRPLIMDIGDLRRRRQPLVVTDVLTDQRTSPVRPAMIRESKRAWIEYLLRTGDDILGVLVFYFDEPRTFSAEEIELLRNFTNQASSSISNARLYTQTDEALHRRVEQLSALADISRELTSTLNLPRLFRLVLDRALEATQSHTGALLLHSDEGMPRLVASQGLSPHKSLLSKATEETFRTGLPSHDEKQLNVPILHGREVYGVISLDRDRDYSADELAFVTQLATQAQIAIENARLFRRIEDARDRLQIILDSMKEAVLLLGAEGHIMLANPRVSDLLGLDPDRIIDLPLGDLVQDAALDIAARLGFSRDSLLKLLQNLKLGQWDATSNDGTRVNFQIQTRFLDRTDAPVRDNAGRAVGLLMVFSDVTKERQLNQAREDLGSMIVHDLRGPLTAITASLKLLNELAPSDSFGVAVRQTTDMASRAVRKMLNLVDSLLDVSKIESGMMTLEREPAQFETLCASVVEELSPLAQELEVNIIVSVPPNMPHLDIDAHKIERVLLNLMDNALKFSPQHGQVIIRALPGTEGFIRIEVADTGPGIPDEYKDKLFDRFTQIEGLRGRRRGTGLGLTFCKLAVEAHDGRIWIEDNPAGGTIFVFTLPVADLQSWDLDE